MEERLLDILIDICGDDVVRKDRDIDLLENEIMDSLDFTELLVTIEEEFGVVLLPSEYKREDVNTPNKIIAIIKARS